MTKTKTFLGKHKKLVAFLLAAVLIVSLFLIFRPQPAVATAAIPQTTILSRMEIKQLVAANGTLQSASSRQVTSNLTFKVTEILVKVGDVVKEGDLLCALDTSDLDKTIADMRKSISSAQAQDALRLEQSERRLQDAINQRDLDQQRLDAEVNAALASYTNADAVAKAQADTAAAALKAVADAVVLDGTPEKQAEYDSALSAYKAAWNAAYEPLYNSQVKPLQEMYNKAVQARDITLRNDNIAIEAARDAVKTSKITDSAQALKTQLTTYLKQKEDAKIVAPISGTVTTINAVVGNFPTAAMGSTPTAAAASSSLFTIQDLQNLEITALVPEYDAVNLKVGLPVEIATDALEGEAWQGTVKTISLIAADSNGNFQVTAKVTSPVGQLTSGMSAKLNIVVESKKNVYAVPFDAVVPNATGESVVYVWLGAEGTSQAAPASGDDATRREIIVETGMESDYYIEIISDELMDGLAIINDPLGKNISNSLPAMGFFGEEG